MRSILHAIPVSTVSSYQLPLGNLLLNVLSLQGLCETIAEEAANRLQCIAPALPANTKEPPAIPNKPTEEDGRLVGELQLGSTQVILDTSMRCYFVEFVLNALFKWQSWCWGASRNGAKLTKFPDSGLHKESDPSPMPESTLIIITKKNGKIILFADQNCWKLDK